MRRVRAAGAGYYGTVAVIMVIGALIGTGIGALWGFLGHEIGWWGVGLLLGLIYGTIAGVSMADRV
jgi:hypothetical protein